MLEGAVTSASAMVFMEDSERAAEIASKHNLDIGLHLNLTVAFSGGFTDSTLVADHARVVKYLRSSKYAQPLYHPLLVRAFQRTFRAQWEQFLKLYGKEPSHLDGHHHMHLCLNVLLSSLIPRGMRVRRHFTLFPTETTFLKASYRRLVDRWLRRRFRCSDYFFSLQPINWERLRAIVGLAAQSEVELAAHPGVDEEFQFLLSEEWTRMRT